MKRLFASLVLSLSLLGAVAPVAHAQLKSGNPFTEKAKSYFSGVYETGVEGQAIQGGLAVAVGQVISGFLGLTGLIMLVIMVYAGFLWLTAGGDDGKVDHAKQLIKNGVIGMAIILSAYIITQFVVTTLTGALGNISSGTQQQKSGNNNVAPPIQNQSNSSGGGGGGAGIAPAQVPPSRTPQ